MRHSLSPQVTRFNANKRPIYSQIDLICRNRQNGSTFRLQSFLVPDISPTPGQSEAIAKASIEAALSMPLWEVAARVAVEIALFAIAAKIVISFVEKLGFRAAKV